MLRSEERFAWMALAGYLYARKPCCCASAPTEEEARSLADRIVEELSEAGEYLGERGRDLLVDKILRRYIPFL